MSETPILEAAGVTVRFGRSGLLSGRGGTVHALNGVDLAVHAGETVGVVGESGCGKSTLARTILGLVTPDSGAVRFDGRDVRDLGRAGRADFRRAVQAVFQDPGSSLNPRKTVGHSIGDLMLLHGVTDRRGVRAAVATMLELVGLTAAHADRMPDELSGGQKQRVAIARAFGIRPRLVVADEAVSALDASVQAQVLDLMADLAQRLGVSYLFISHDLDIVRAISDRVVVMYLGRIVESGTAAEVMETPKHPYTRALLASRLVADPTRARPPVPVLTGDVPSPRSLPGGCPFHTRCPEILDPCHTAVVSELEWPLRPGTTRDRHLASCLRVSTPIGPEQPSPR